MSQNLTNQQPPQSYQITLQDLVLTIQQARYKMLTAVATETVRLYWQIGKTVSQKTAEEKWGAGVVEKLAKDLQTEFPGVRGFSASNLWRMRTFYETYKDNEKLAPLVREIGWTQNKLIFEKCKDDLQREFYLKKTNSDPIRAKTPC